VRRRRSITKEYLQAVAYLHKENKIPLLTISAFFNLKIVNNQVPEYDGTFQLPVDLTYARGSFNKYTQLQMQMHKLIPFKHYFYTLLDGGYGADHNKKVSFINEPIQMLITQMLRYSPWNSATIGGFMLMPTKIIEQVAFNNRKIEFIEPMSFPDLEYERLVSLIGSYIQPPMQIRFKNYLRLANDEQRKRLRALRD